MTVSLTTPINEYIANGSTTIFPYTFRTTETAQVKVYVGGVLQTSGYTISQYDTNAGNVTFTTAPTNGSIVRIQRSITLNRETDYLDGGALAATSLDNDFDKIVMMIQDLDANAIKELSQEILDAQSKKILNVATPTAGTDAANKAYVDSIPFILGNVIAPANPADNGKVLTAASGLWGWTQKKIWKSAQEIYSGVFIEVQDSDIITDTSGNIYLALYCKADDNSATTSYIIKITPALDYSIFASATTADTGGTALARDSSDNIYWAVNQYAQAGANCYVYKITSAGVKTTFATQSLTGAKGTALAIDSNNNVFWAVSQFYNGTTYALNSYVYKITSAGVKTTFATQATIGCSDVDLVFDNSNYLYWAVNNRYNGTTFFQTNYVYRISQDTTIGTFASAANSYSTNTAIIFDGSNLYWTFNNQYDTGTSSYDITSYVYKITLAGVKTTEMSKRVEGALGTSLTVDSDGNLYWALSCSKNGGDASDRSAYVFVRETGTTSIKTFNSFRVYNSFSANVFYGNNNIYTWASNTIDGLGSSLRSRLYINYNKSI
jgi:hypothetical protein